MVDNHHIMFEMSILPLLLVVTMEMPGAFLRVSLTAVFTFLKNNNKIIFFTKSILSTANICRENNNRLGLNANAQNHI